MFNKKNPMRYFSGSTFARLPLYKLAAGGTAVVLTASIGLGAFAASVGPLSAPEPSPTPIVTASLVLQIMSITFMELLGLQEMA